MVLKNKIDFLGIISAEKCNPNGDPMYGNRPRKDFEGHGIMTPECLKRKIRNRLQDAGEKILVQSNDRIDDGHKSIKKRFEAFIKSEKIYKDPEELQKKTCSQWIDARSFGCIVPYKGTSKESVTVGVRGPVSIGYATSIDIVDIIDVMITKSTNIENLDPGEKDSSTIGYKYIINKGAYVFFGSIYPDLAKRTGFTDEDAEKIKDAILTIFENDASHGRPSGSMTLSRLYWWVSPGLCSKIPPAKLFHSVHLNPSPEWPFFEEEYEPINGLDPEIYGI